MENFNMNNTFFFINKTQFFFPKLSYTKENVPVGDSISMCIAVNWAPVERGHNYDLMKPVEGFPRCKETLSGQFIWNVDDPIYGIDVPVWIQKSEDIDCTDEDDCNRYCNSLQAEFVNGRNSKKCYSYDILDTVCLVVEYDPLSEKYIYSGGCFKDGLHYLMAPADREKTHYFSGIEIEVRNKKDPVIKAGEMSNFTYSFGENWNFIAIFLNFVLFLSLIGLIVIAYYIWTYRKKYNSGALLSEKPRELEKEKNTSVNNANNTDDKQLESRV